MLFYHVNLFLAILGTVNTHGRHGNPYSDREEMLKELTDNISTLTNAAPVTVRPKGGWILITKRVVSPGPLTESRRDNAPTKPPTTSPPIHKVPKNGTGNSHENSSQDGGSPVVDKESTRGRGTTRVGEAIPHVGGGAWTGSRDHNGVTNHTSDADGSPRDANSTMEHSFSVYNSHTGEMDRRVLTSTEEGRRTNKDDLCQPCLCNDDLRDIVCLHSHAQAIGSHALNLTQTLIPPTAQTLLVTGYEQVWVQPGTFVRQQSSLTSITFQDIKTLHVKPNSFFFSSVAQKNKQVTVAFHNCGIPSFPKEAFTQRVHGRHEAGDRVIFERERTRYLSLHINKCKIGVLEQNSFRQARLATLNISRTNIEKIEPKAIDLDINVVAKFYGNHLPSLPPYAICLHTKNTILIANNIEEISNRAISVEVEGQVEFQRNTIGLLRSGALMGIIPREKTYGSGISFINNILKEAEPNSLAVDPAFSVQKFFFKNNTFEGLACECNITVAIKDLLGNASYMQDTLDFVVSGSRCMKKFSTATPRVDDYLTDDCQPFPVATVSAVGAAFFLLVVAITLCVVCSLRVQQVKEESNMLGECPSQSFSTLNRPFNENTLRTPTEDGRFSPPNFALLGPWGAAVPEIKTYQQNQTPAFTEQAESISGSRGTLSSLFNQRLNPENRASCPLN